MEFDGPGSTIKRNADGTMSISTTAGDVIEIDQKGSASVHLKQIKAVGIHNLADVESHNINNIVGSVSHLCGLLVAVKSGLYITPAASLLSCQPPMSSPRSPKTMKLFSSANR